MHELARVALVAAIGAVASLLVERAWSRHRRRERDRAEAAKEPPTTGGDA